MSSSNPTAQPATSCNVAVLRGRVASEPRRRELPSGACVVELDLATHVDGATLTVPVVWEPGRAMPPAADDDVVAVGLVRRRFFRAGGVTQSRTEVVASHVVPARRRREVARVVGAAVAGAEAASGG